MRAGRETDGAGGALIAWQDSRGGATSDIYARRVLVSGVADPALRARGAELAKTMGCGSCHLPDYRGQKQVPRLDYQREDYLVAAMKAYRHRAQAS